MKSWGGGGYRGYLIDVALGITTSILDLEALSHAIEHLHVTSHVQVVVYSLVLTVLIYGTLAYLRMKLFLKTKLTDAE